MATWKQVAERANADMVAGTLIAHIGGAHVALGHLKQEQVILTEAGRDIAAEIDAESRAAAITAAAEDEAQDEAPPEDADEGQDNISVELEDDVSVEELLGQE